MNIQNIGGPQMESTIESLLSSTEQESSPTTTTPSTPMDHMHVLNDSGNELMGVLQHQAKLVQIFNHAKLQLIHEIQSLQSQNDLYSKTIDNVLNSSTQDIEKIKEVLKQLRNR